MSIWFGLQAPQCRRTRGRRRGAAGELTRHWAGPFRSAFDPRNLQPADCHLGAGRSSQPRALSGHSRGPLALTAGPRTPENKNVLFNPAGAPPAGSRTQLLIPSAADWVTRSSRAGCHWSISCLLAALYCLCRCSLTSHSLQPSLASMEPPALCTGLRVRQAPSSADSTCAPRLRAS